MPETTQFIDSVEGYSSAPTGALRYLDGVLQQEWSCLLYYNGGAGRRETEWRDVEQVTSEEPANA